MKFKLIQIAALVIFVMSVVFLAQTPNGYGGPIVNSEGGAIVHDASSHDPSFYIDACGYRKENGTDDPREKWFNEPICGTDRDEYVSEKSWFYRGSGEYSGTHPANPKSKSPGEQIYRIKLEGSATANASHAKGSLSPGLEYMSTLPRIYDSWDGTGHIHLEITELVYHYKSIYLVSCIELTAKKHEWAPTEDAHIVVTVHPTKYVKTKTSKVYAEGEYAGNGIFSGSFGGEYSHSWSEEVASHLKGFSYGIQADVGYGWWDTYWNPEIKLQKKKAVVSGHIEKTTEWEGASVSMTANYAQAGNTWCPYSSDPNHIPESIPHQIN